jgi:hypothetical protein
LEDPGGRVAVTVAVRVSVPIEPIDRGVIHHGIAVLIDAIAGLVCPRVDGGGVVPTVTCHDGMPARKSTSIDGAVRVAISISVPVHIEARGDALIDDGIAVLIDTVAAFGRIRVHPCLTIVTFLTGGPSVAISVDIADGAIAVVVQRVGAVALRGTWVHRGVCVPAVSVHRDQPIGPITLKDGLSGTVSITVQVRIPGGGVRCSFIDLAIAVLIGAVAELRCARVDAPGRVITVIGIRSLAFKTLASKLGLSRPMAVTIQVLVPGCAVGGPIVDLSVAILIDAVADLGCARVYGRVRVVTVSAQFHCSTWLLTGGARVSAMAVSV